MRLTECFDRVLVVPNDLPFAQDAELEALQLCTHGVLLTTPETAWVADQHCDALAEQLDARAWTVVYLGHEAEVGENVNEAPQLVRCALPPTTVTALAVRPEMLRHLLDVCGTGHIAGQLTPTDWLTMASWMLLDQCPAGTLWGTYPGLQPVRRASGAPDGPHGPSHLSLSHVA